MELKKRAASPISRPDQIKIKYKVTRDKKYAIFMKLIRNTDGKFSIRVFCQFLNIFILQISPVTIVVIMISGIIYVPL